MSYRVTEKHLNAKIETLNKLLGRPVAPWTRKASGQGMTANIGNFHLSGAYGGVSLHEMTTDGGGIRDVFRCGHVPKRELAGLIDAYMQRIYDEQSERRERAA